MAQEQPEWMADEAVKNIDRRKLDFLQALVVESKGLSPKEMFPFLMSVMKKAKEQNLQFQDNELQILIQTIKKYSTAEELSTIDKMLAARKKG